jgi:monothiol glutaredoxin
MPNAEATIRDLVTSKKVVLFMKGSRHFPQCGFSAQVVEILNKLVPTYDTVNVLADPEIRDGIKKFSDWPTIPQLYIDGKFVGGCDIIKEMFANGELAATLGSVTQAGPTEKQPAPSAPPPSGPPVITVTERAAKAILAARETPGEDLRVQISPTFDNELFFDGPQAGDVVVEAGAVTLRLDPASATRAHGMSVDFVETPSGGGFKVDNPKAPARAPEVRSMTPKGLRAALDAKEPVTLFDVRTAAEIATASVKEAVVMNDEGQKRLAGMPKSSKIVFMCHHGMRSRVAAEAAVRQGFTEVWNLEGGIEAWSVEVDATVPRY